MFNFQPSSPLQPRRFDLIHYECLNASPFSGICGARCIHPWPAAVHFKSSQLVRSPHEHSSHFPVSASAPWTVKLLYKSTCMNHLETHFSFTQLGRKRTKGQRSLLPAAHHPAPSHFLLDAPLSSSTRPPPPLSPSRHPPTPQPLSSRLPLTCVCPCTLNPHRLRLSPVSPQLWRTAGSSWWISLTTNCGCLCPMCHFPMRDAMCASSTRILLRKPTQTSLSWVGVRVHVRPSHTYKSHSFQFLFFSVL